MVTEEAMNCVNNCTSPLCFQVSDIACFSLSLSDRLEEVYGAMPLEDGEVDERRNRLFTSCLRRETSNMRKVSPLDLSCLLHLTASSLPPATASGGE
jgi:hypothetical protein